MIWKALLLTILAVGVLANDYVKPEDLIESYCKLKDVTDKDVVDAKNAFDTFGNNIKKILGPIEAELDGSRSNSSGTREVFRRFCSKSPELKSSLHVLLAGIRPCLSQTKRDNAANNSTDKIVDFICYNEAERISYFVTEGASECYRSQSEAINDCYKKGVPSSPEIVKKLTDAEQCALFEQFTTCAVKALRNCPSAAPADFSESLFKYAHSLKMCLNFQIGSPNHSFLLGM